MVISFIFAGFSIYFLIVNWKLALVSFIMAFIVSYMFLAKLFERIIIVPIAILLEKLTR